jgi:hypothetical protein
MSTDTTFDRRRFLGAAATTVAAITIASDFDGP